MDVVIDTGDSTGDVRSTEMRRGERMCETDGLRASYDRDTAIDEERASAWVLRVADRSDQAEKDRGRGTRG